MTRTSFASSQSLHKSALIEIEAKRSVDSFCPVDLWTPQSTSDSDSNVPSSEINSSFDSQISFCQGYCAKSIFSFLKPAYNCLILYTDTNTTKFGNKH